MTPARSRPAWTRDFAASIVVFLVALPLCMGIALASGVPVSAGLITGIVAGIVVGALAGCPLQVSGPAAGLTVIVYSAVQEFGLEMLGLIVFFAGLFQLVAGQLKLGQWFRAVSPSVVKGMLSGIGILILASQIHVMLDDKPKEDGLQNLLTIPQAITKAFRVPTFESTETNHQKRLLVQELGELHRQQSLLYERLSERIPHQPRRRDPAPDPLPYDDLLDDQQTLTTAIVDEVAKVERIQSKSARQNREWAQHHAQLVATAERATQSIANQQTESILPQQRALLEALEGLMGELKNHELAAGLGVITILILAFWGRLVPQRLRFIPAPLVAVVTASVLAVLLELPVLSVEVPTSMLDEIRLPTWAILRDAPWLALVQAGLVMAAVASAETLLSATAVDQMHQGPRTRYDRELSAQGIGNMVCGFVGALPITGVIVRSTANVQAGAQTRWSAIFHGIWLLIFVAGFPTVLRLVPTSSLAAVLVFTGFKLVDFKALRELRHYGWSEVAIYLATILTIVTFDLLTGVAFGVGLAALRLLVTFSRLHTEIQTSTDGQTTHLKLHGAATFVRLPQLASVLEQVPPNTQLHVELEKLSYIDHACLNLIMGWAKQHEATGGTLTIDWDTLQARIQGGNKIDRGRGSHVA